MNLVYQDTYQKIEFDQEYKIMTFKTFETIKELNEKQYIEIVVKKGAETILKYKPQNLLVGIQNFSIILSLQAEKQIQKIFVETYKKANVKKLAIVLPFNTLAQKTLFQIVEVDLEYSFERGYFIDESKALKWLKGEIEN